MTERKPLIVAPNLLVNQMQREEMKQQHACCIWLTGLSGSGKSTLGIELDRALQHNGLHSYLLDGDRLRQGICRDLGMSDADRHENVRRIAEVARLMVDAGLIVIVCAISPFRADRDAVRHSLANGEFVEVHVSTPFDECARRDTKGLYRAAQQGLLKNFTGLDSPYEAPLQPEFIVDTSVDDCNAFIEQLVTEQLGGIAPRPTRYTVMSIKGGTA
jgi:adenylyl-sulfate kinase